MKWEKFRFLLVLAGLLALVEVARRLGAAHVFETMLTQHPGWFAVALAFAVLNLCLSANRSRWIASGQLRMLPVLRITSVACIVNHLTLFTGGGMAAKALGFQRLGVSPGKSAEMVGVEVLLDVLFTFAVTLAGLMFLGVGRFAGTQVMADGEFYGLVVACCALIFAGVVFRIRGKLRAGEAATTPMPRFGGFSLRCVFLSAAVWVSSAMSFYCLLRGSGETVSLWITVVAMSSGFLLSLATFVPGGLGVRDVAWSAICSNLTLVPMTTSLAASLTLRLISLLGACLLVITLAVLHIFTRRGMHDDPG